MKRCVHLFTVDKNHLDVLGIGNIFRRIAAHDDQSRICGLAPTYALLRCAEPGAGRLLRYEQSEEPGGSLVSIGSMVWP